MPEYSAPDRPTALERQQMTAPKRSSAPTDCVGHARRSLGREHPTTQALQIVPRAELAPEREHPTTQALQIVPRECTASAPMRPMVPEGELDFASALREATTWRCPPEELAQLRLEGAELGAEEGRSGA